MELTDLLERAEKRGWNPDLHPRGWHGHWIDAVKNLRDGESISLLGDVGRVHVERHAPDAGNINGFFRVEEGGRQHNFYPPFRRADQGGPEAGMVHAAERAANHAIIRHGQLEVQVGDVVRNRNAGMAGRRGRLHKPETAVRGRVIAVEPDRVRVRNVDHRGKVRNNWWQRDKIIPDMMGFKPKIGERVRNPNAKAGQQFGGAVGTVRQISPSGNRVRVHLAGASAGNRRWWKVENLTPPELRGQDIQRSPRRGDKPRVAPAAAAAAAAAARPLDLEHHLPLPAGARPVVGGVVWHDLLSANDNFRRGAFAHLNGAVAYRRVGRGANGHGIYEVHNGREKALIQRKVDAFGHLRYVRVDRAEDRVAERIQRRPQPKPRPASADDLPRTYPIDAPANIARAPLGEFAPRANPPRPSTPDWITSGKLSDVRRLGGGIEDSEVAVIDGKKVVLKPAISEEFVRDHMPSNRGAREVGAGVIAARLGVRMPPTTFRTVDGEKKSVQQMIPHAVNLFDAFRAPAIPDDEKLRNGVFDGVIANTDRHGGNAIVDHDGKGKLWLIDHGLSFPTGKSGGNTKFLSQVAGKALTPDIRAALTHMEAEHDQLTAELLGLGLEQKSVDLMWQRVHLFLAMDRVPEPSQLGL